MKQLAGEKQLFMILALLIVLFVWQAADIQAQTDDYNDEEVTVFMKDILFSGNSVITTEALREAVKDFKGKELTLADMNTVAELVTMTYQERGYVLARAYLPEQGITNGYLIVAVLEGRIENVAVEGNKFYDPKLLKRFFNPQIEHGVVTEKMLEKELLLANELASAETSLVLKRGGKPGYVNVGLKTNDDVPFSLGVDYNNFGTESVSVNRYGVVASMADPWLGTNLTLRGVTGDNLDRSSMFSANYEIPINSIGTQVTLSYVNGVYATGGEIAAAEYQGNTKLFGARISHPLIKNRDTALNISMGWDHKYAEYQDDSLESVYTGGIYAIDDLDEYYVRLDFDNLDRFLGKNLVSLIVTHGDLTDRYDTPSYRKIIDGTDNNRFISKSSTNYQRYSFSAARIQKVYGYTNFMLRSTGQYAGAEYLNPLSWFTIGGYGTVRGWKPGNQQEGDSGYTVTGELMFAPPYVGEKAFWGQKLAQMVQFALFYDHGGVFIETPLEDIKGGGVTEALRYKSEFLNGWGFGMRLFYKDRFRFKLDVGFPVGDRPDGADESVVYILGSYNFF